MLARTSASPAKMERSVAMNRGSSRSRAMTPSIDSNAMKGSCASTAPSATRTRSTSIRPDDPRSSLVIPIWKLEIARNDAVHRLERDEGQLRVDGAKRDPYALDVDPS